MHSCMLDTIPFDMVFIVWCGLHMPSVINQPSLCTVRKLTVAVQTVCTYMLVIIYILWNSLNCIIANIYLLISLDSPESNWALDSPCDVVLVSRRDNDLDSTCERSQDFLSKMALDSTRGTSLDSAGSRSLDSPRDRFLDSLRDRSLDTPRDRSLDSPRGR